MKSTFSTQLHEDLVQTVDLELNRNGIVNIPVLAEQIRLRNAAENVALEDIAQWLLHHAESRNAAMVFDSDDRHRLNS